MCIKAGAKVRIFFHSAKCFKEKIKFFVALMLDRLTSALVEPLFLGTSIEDAILFVSVSSST